jgi:hypothetical protein
MSTLRPTLYTTNEPALYDGTAYLAIYNAVKEQPGLLHGKLKNGKGDYCAIGSYFALPSHMALPNTLIDEVAAINDSAPRLTPRQRKRMVLRWLRWKLAEAGMPGYRAAKQKRVKRAAVPRG